MNNLTPCLSRQLFFYKNNKNIKRESAGNPVILPDGRIVRLEFATMADVEMVTEQLLYGFVNQIGIYRTLGTSEDEMRSLFTKATTHFIASNGTILGWIDDDLVAVWATKCIAKEKIPSNFGRRAFLGEKPVFMIPEDYGNVVASMPGENFNSKLILCVLNAVEEQLAKFLPNNVEKLCVDEIIFVHDSLRGTKIGNQILHRSHELARKRGCNYATMVAIAVASQKLAKKNGYETCFSLPFDKIRVNCSYPIKETWDGTSEIQAVVKKL